MKSAHFLVTAALAAAVFGCSGGNAAGDMRGEPEGGNTGGTNATGSTDSFDGGHPTGGSDSGRGGSGGKGGRGANGGNGSGVTGGSGGSDASGGGGASSENGGTGGSAASGGNGGAGGFADSPTCAATGKAYCTVINGWQARCYGDGHAAYCPSDLPRCYQLSNGNVTCVQSESQPCDPASYQDHCRGDTIMTCYKLDDGSGVTWPTNCGDAPTCLDPDTGEYDLPGPCRCATLKNGSPACIPSSAQTCDPASAPRTCNGNVLHYCAASGLTAEHDCGSNMVCHEGGETAGCVVSPLTPCSNVVPLCYSSTVAQLCCDPNQSAPDTCLPGYLTLEDCQEELGPTGVCDSAWHNCIPL